jgi:ABC-type nitrate/sulfonate/bicarbonate transport system permease component
MRYSMVSIFSMLLIWWAISIIGIVNQLLLPPPLAVGQNLINLLLNGTLNNDINSTVSRFILGYIGGVVSGIPIGLLMGMSRISYQLLEFPTDFFRSLPVTALFPLFLLCFGVGDTSKVAMIWMAVIFIVAVNATYGVIQAPKKRLQMARSFRANRRQIFFDIIIWESVPQIVVGMRVALSTALIVAIVGEMFIGTQYGIGQRLYDAYSKSLIEELYSMILIVGIIGYLANKLFLIIEKRLIFWVGK